MAQADILLSIRGKRNEKDIDIINCYTLLQF